MVPVLWKSVNRNSFLFPRFGPFFALVIKMFSLHHRPCQCHCKRLGSYWEAAAVREICLPSPYGSRFARLQQAGVSHRINNAYYTKSSGIGHSHNSRLVIDFAVGETEVYFWDSGTCRRQTHTDGNVLVECSTFFKTSLCSNLFILLNLILRVVYVLFKNT